MIGSLAKYDAARNALAQARSVDDTSENFWRSPAWVIRYNYDHSPRGRARRRRYNQSEKGKARNRRYNATEKRRAADRRRRQDPVYRAKQYWHHKNWARVNRPTIEQQRYIL